MKLPSSSRYCFYKNVLKSPKYVLAPMVKQSELAWRMMARKNGAELCYTPMHSSHRMLWDKDYCNEILQDITCKEDRPLIVQFCANSVKDLILASLLVEKHCDGIDLNLGCPQAVAELGYFGAFLQDDWELVHDMISETRQHVGVELSAKIRVFPQVTQTVEYAKMLEEAGCSLLTVHGRTRDQKQKKTGLADWSQIKAVKDNVNIPVFANGNIRYHKDVAKCLEETGADGVMAAEGHLSNPMIFKDVESNVFDVIDEYLDFTERYPTSMSFMRLHVATLLAPTFQRHPQFQHSISHTSTMEIFEVALKQLRERCGQDNVEESLVESTGLPYWTCQPFNKYLRSSESLTDNTDEETCDDEVPLSKRERIQRCRSRYRINKMFRRKKEENERWKEEHQQRPKENIYLQRRKQ